MALDSGIWFRDVVDRYERRLVRYAGRLLLDPERARDVVQEAFLRLAKQGLAESDRARLEPRLAEWLFTVVRNLALDVRGKESRMQSLDNVQIHSRTSPEPGPDQAVEQLEARSAVLRVVAGLPENQQEVIRLKFQEGLSYKEISRITDHSVSYVGVLVHHAMQTLRRNFGRSDLKDFGIPGTIPARPAAGQGGAA